MEEREGLEEGGVFEGCVEGLRSGSVRGLDCKWGRRTNGLSRRMEGSQGEEGEGGAGGRAEGDGG